MTRRRHWERRQHGCGSCVRRRTQSKVGRRVVAGGGFDPLATGALVRQGELPDIFALTDEKFNLEADYKTLDAANAAELMRMPIIDASKMGWSSKHRRSTGWHHVRVTTESKFAGEWNYTHLTPDECLRVRAECEWWFDPQGPRWVWGERERGLGLGT